MQVEPLTSPFEALTQAIIYQQLSGKAASTIHGRFLDQFENRLPTPLTVLKLGEEVLRGAGLSRAKSLAVLDLAAKTQAGDIGSAEQLQALSDEQILKRLTEVRGIGPWTVKMLLIFRLGRPDVLPVEDLGVRKGFMLSYGLEQLPEPDELESHAQCWRPFRSVAAWYMWRALEV